MAIVYVEDRVVFRDVASGEEAEELLGWLQGQEFAKLDLQDCTHIHPATLQVLLAAQIEISSWPEDRSLRAWLEPLFPLRLPEGSEAEGQKVQQKAFHQQATNPFHPDATPEIGAVSRESVEPEVGSKH